MTRMMATVLPLFVAASGMPLAQDHIEPGRRRNA